MEWFTKGTDGMWMVVLSTTLVYAALVLFTRLSGLRSFSKMSSFDFATTIAMGSIIATSVVAQDPPVIQGITALGTIFVLQYIAARMRRSTDLGSKMFHNKPLLVVDRGKFLEDNMRHARITDDDIYAKLREANVFDMSEVRAVVLETTGDVSVLHAKDPDRRLDPEILTGVRDREEFGSSEQAEKSWSGGRESPA